MILGRSNRISELARIYPNVHFGENVTVEDFCIIGCPFNDSVSPETHTYIGSNALLRSFTVIYAGNNIGSDFQTGNKVNIRQNNTIGNKVSIGSHTVVEHSTIIEDEVRIHSQAFIPEHCHLKKGAWVGPNVVLTNAKYPTSPKVKTTIKGPTIGEKAILGANSTVLPGLHVGKNSILGAGSVLTKDLPEGFVGVGNPARLVKKKSELPYEVE